MCATGALSDGRLRGRLAPAQPDACACCFLLWEVRSHWGGKQSPILNPRTIIFCSIFTKQIFWKSDYQTSSEFLPPCPKSPKSSLPRHPLWVSVRQQHKGQKMAFFGPSPKCGGWGSESPNFCAFLETIFCTKTSKNAMKHMILSFKMKGDVISDQQWATYRPDCAFVNQNKY